MTSPNFTVFSNAGDEQARRVALEFEVIRSVFQAALPNATSDPNRPLVILAVEDEDDLESLFPQLQGRGGPVPNGIYRAGPLRHHIVLRTDTGGRERYQVVYHEYFHLVTSLTSGRLPPWLMEGLAEVYSNTTIRGRTAEVGDHRPDYLEFLSTQRMLPLDELIAADVDPHQADAYGTMLFYAQSWALTHYLLLGDESGRGPQQVRAYTDQVRQGTNGRAAFEQVFGDVDDVERELSRYVRRSGFYGMRLDAPLSVSDEAFTVRGLSDAEALSIRAGVLVQSARPQDARRLIDEALSLESRSPQAHEALGLFFLQRDELEDAELAFSDAVGFGSTSYIPYYLGAVLASREGDADRLDDIERLLRRSVALNPRFAPSYALLAGVLAGDPSRNEEALELARESVRLEPTGVQHWVALGEALMADNQTDEARATVNEGLDWVVDPGERQRLEAFRAETHDPRPIVERAHVLSSTGDFDAALAAYRSALGVDPEYVPAHNGVGATLVALERLDEAAEAHGQAIELDPTNADSYNALGVVHARRAELEGAVTAFRLALEYDPLHAVASRNLAVTLSRLGRLEEA